jgi:CubicO group peptidase (beta-lactamase class C family)
MTSKTIEQAIEAAFDNFFEENAFNGVVAVAEDGDITFKKAWGIANLDEEPLKTSSIFNLASVSKQFTAMCIMLLSEDEVLDYDTSIGEYIPEFEDSAYQDITVRHLLNHTSGLPDYMDLLDEDWEWDQDEIATNDDLIALFAEHQPELEFEPGDQYEYSNTGYAFLATIVERVSGARFEEFLQERIFGPLDMTHSFGYRTSDGPPPQAKADGFELDDDGEYEANDTCYMDGIIGDGNIFSNVTDLVKYNAALYTDELISQEALAEAYVPGELNNGEQTEYGFGWDLYESGDFVSHTGSWMGFRTYIQRDMSSKRIFIALDNSSNEAIDEQLDSVVDAFYS